MTSKRRTGKAPAEERSGTTTPLEWLAAIVGMGVVLAALSVLVHQTVTGADGPATIATDVVAVKRVGSSYMVEVEVANRGGRTAGQLKIEGKVAGPGGEAETSDTIIDYLPPGSTRPISLLFSRDPSAAGLKVRAVSFSDP
jgi:uncharacterized protein (TIGR02588 family)